MGSEIAFRVFHYGDTHQVVRKAKTLFGKDYEYKENKFLYDTTFDIIQAALSFANKVGRENVVSISGGDNFYSYYEKTQRFGSVVVYYWKESSADKKELDQRLVVDVVDALTSLTDEVEHWKEAFANEQRLTEKLAAENKKLTDERQKLSPRISGANETAQKYAPKIRPNELISNALTLYLHS